MDDRAREIGLLMVGCAREHGWLGSELVLVPELAEVERELFIELFRRLRVHLEKSHEAELTLDEIGSMFAFVFAKAAEAVTNYVNGSEQKLDYLGVFDGKIPVYADENLLGYFKKLNYSGVMGGCFVDYFQAQGERQDPTLSLFEALKWTWRIAQSLALEYRCGA